MDIPTNNFDNAWPSEEFLAAAAHPVFNHALQALLIAIDRNGHIVFINQAFLSISGFNRDELLGAHFSILFPPHQHASIKANFVAQLTRGEFSSDFVIPLRDKMKKAFYIHWSTSVLTDRQGNFEYLVGNGIDATEHRDTLRHFEQSRKRFQNLVETTSDWVWETDERQRFTYSNPQVETLLGYRPEEIIGKTPFDLMLTEEAHRLTEQFSQLPETAHIERVLNIKLHKDGHRVAMETSGRPFFSKKGERLGFRGITRDISDRQNALLALQKSEARLRLSQQLANVGNWEWDIASGSVYWSEQMWSLFGREINSFPPTYKLFLQSIHPDDRDMMIQTINNALRRNTSYDVEFRAIWPNGETHWLRDIGSVDNSGHEKTERMLGLVLNIDQRKHNEQKQARQAEEQRNTLVREVHHRIKNNLQGIIGLLRNTLKNEASNPRTAVEKAITQINAIALIHGIHGQQNEGDLLLCEMLPAIVHNHVLPGQDIADIDLSVDIDCPLQLQNSEAVPVALILNELITNALKHASNAHERVGVSLDVVKGQGAIRIHCPGGHLPAGFDFQRGEKFGTGLELVRALLPPAGMSIQYQQIPTGVTTEVMLQSPIVRSTAKEQDNSLADT